MYFELDHYQTFREGPNGYHSGPEGVYKLKKIVPRVCRQFWAPNGPLVVYDK